MKTIMPSAMRVSSTFPVRIRVYFFSSFSAKRNKKKTFAHFASLVPIESGRAVNTLLHLKIPDNICESKHLGYVEAGKLAELIDKIVEVERMLKALIKSLEKKHLAP